ncbi:endonuclease MutS2 [bacterium]|nr:endonuclease MutS2 [bacterium]
MTPPKDDLKNYPDPALELLEWPRVLAYLAGHAMSAPGREACYAIAPADDLDTARRLLSETGEARALAAEGVEPPLGSVEDIAPLLARLRAGGALDAFEVRVCADILAAARLARTLLSDNWEAHPRIGQIAARLYEDLALEREIFTAIEPNGEVADAASDTLARLRRRYRDVHKQIHETMQRLAASPELADYLQDDIFTLRNGRYVLVVKIEKHVKIDGIVHDVSNTRRSLFVEPREVTQLNNVLRQTQIDIDQEIERILAEFSRQIAARSTPLAETCADLVALDLAFARARFAAKLGAHAPALAEDGALKLEQLRHPHLVMQGGEVIANDVELPAETACVVITGPNTGGKTVLLKAVGLASLMARAGLFPPVDEQSALPFSPRVFAIIGDKQSIETGLSTFAARVAAMKDVLDRAGAGDLVLIDEIGEGTEPRQGVALSMALLERLTGRGARTFATTHFVELAAMAENRERFVNASMEFDRERMVPTYRFRKGIPGRSGAFDVAARMGLPAELLDRARELYEGASSELDAVMERLERAHREAETRAHEAERLKREAAHLVEVQRDRVRELDARRRDAANTELAAVRASYDEAREVIRAAIARLQRGDVTFADAEEARERIDEALAESEAKTPPAPQEKQRGEPRRLAPDEIEPGRVVYVAPMNAEGEVASGPDVKGRVAVMVGGVRVSVDANDLRAASRAAREEPRVRIEKPKPDFDAATPDSTLDLRGQFADDARDLLREFLDRATMAKLPRLYVIHGHGTGKLKREVRDYLRVEAPNLVARPGDRHEGGDGVTVIELEGGSVEG